MSVFAVRAVVAWRSVWRRRLRFCAIGLVAASAPASWAQVTPSPGYAKAFEIADAGLGRIDLASDTQLIGTTTTTLSFDPFQAVANLHGVTLDGGPVGTAFFTQTVLPASATTFDGFAVTNGTYTLTGQSGDVIDDPGQPDDDLFRGRVFLTENATGSTTTLDVPGNFAATATSGDFFVSAAAGTATGLGSSFSSGVYGVEHSAAVAGTLDGLNLIIDTGAASGTVGSDSAGNLAFALGGASSTIAGGGFNDIYYLPKGGVDAAQAAGPTTGAPGTDADRLLTIADLIGAAGAFFTAQRPGDADPAADFLSIGGLLFDGDGDLIVGVTDFYFDLQFDFKGSAGIALLFDVTDNGGDMQAAFLESIFFDPTGGVGSLTYRGSDGALITSNTNASFGTDVVGVAIAPLPAAAQAGVALMATLGVRLRIGRRSR